MSGTPLGVLRRAAARLGVTVDEYLSLRGAGLKFCWRCRQWRAVPLFGVDRSRADGLAARCYGCLRVPPRQLPLLHETDAEYDRRQYATNPVFRFNRQQRSAQRKRGVDAVPLIGQEALTEQFAGRCAYCPALATTWDHIVSVAKGGETVPGNIVPACRSCNSRKKDRDVEDFLEQNGLAIGDELEAVMALACEGGLTP